MKKIVIALLALVVLILGSYYFLKKTPTKVNQNMNFPEEKNNQPASPSAQIQIELKIEDLKVGQGKEVKKGDNITILGQSVP